MGSDWHHELLSGTNGLRVAAQFCSQVRACSVDGATCYQDPLQSFLVCYCSLGNGITSQKALILWVQRSRIGIMEGIHFAFPTAALDIHRKLTIKQGHQQL